MAAILGEDGFIRAQLAAGNIGLGRNLSDRGGRLAAMMDREPVMWL